MSSTDPSLADTLVVVYASRSAKKTENDETAQQIRKVRAAVEREGERRIVEEYEEDNRSGFKGNRGPELEAAIDHAVRVAGEGLTVELWVWASNRLARGSGRMGEARSVNEVLAYLRRRGVAVRSVSDDVFVSNQMLWGFAAEQAAKYSADLSANVVRGKDEQWERGHWLGGPIPDGFVGVLVNPDNARNRAARLEIDPEREPIIRRIWALALDGVAPAPLARMLNAERIRTRPTKQRPEGTNWTRRRLQDLLSNPAYAGVLVRWRGTDREQRRTTDWPAYVSVDELASVAHFAKQRDVTASGRKNGGRPSRHFLLSTLARCWKCGGTAYARTSTYKRKDGTHARHYDCAHTVNGTGLCDAASSRADLVDAYVLEHLPDFAQSAARWLAELGHDHGGAEDGAQRALGQAQRHAGELAARVERLEDRYARLDDLDGDEADALLSMIGRERAALTRASELVDRASDDLAAVRRTLTGDNVEGSQRLLDEALRTGSTATVKDCNLMLRDHFDAFVLTGDDERPAVPIWKLDVPAKVAATLPEVDVDALLDESLAPYMRAAEREHNVESFQEPSRILLRVPLAA